MRKIDEKGMQDEGHRAGALSGPDGQATPKYAKFFRVRDQLISRAVHHEIRKLQVEFAERNCIPLGAIED